ncbi:MAG TPA: DapH/DapD/GlmU-related protein [Candidatus Baltobacteraceae bacterium]|jgi:acetyltransferase-like isoleucine patch superfamily enzyme|nr:DapH/DapD/GlmU-related protein [Candidatus Baltobacteraceae bacterium]
MHVISDLAIVSDKADIEDSIRGSKLVVGAHTMIDSFVKIKFTGGLGDIIIGEHCQLNSGIVIYSGNGITLGNDVLVAANTTFAPTNHAYDRRDVPLRTQRFKPSKGGIVVEDDVWIGSNCVLLDGAVLRRGTIVAANSVIRDETEPYGIYAGSPAKLIGSRP